ncbi:hypothetical protein HDV01_001231 [Terramyces sp. JEL0728]|nr:hypothetical protein HDV01_001231 [Terramyces sp. JEL0728]
MQKYTYQSVWETGECGGPPLAMYVFPQSKGLLNFTSFESYTSDCGSSPVEMDVGCCAVSLNMELTQGYHSMSFHNLTAQYTISNSAPVQANGASYCSLTSTQDSLLGNSVIYYLYSNRCMDSHFKCLENLTFFSDSNCGGNSTDLQVNNQYFFDGFGNFTVSYLKIASGTVQYTWTTFIGGTYLLNDFKIPMEVICMFSYLFSLTAFLLLSIKYIFKYTKTGKVSNVIFSFITFIWGTSILIKMIDSYVAIKNPVSLKAMTILLAFTLIPSMINSIISTFILCKMAKLKKYHYWIVIAAITLIFGFLLWQVYMNIALSYLHEEQSPDYGPPGKELIWHILSLSIDILPPMGMCHLLFNFNKAESIKSGRNYALSNDFLYPTKKLIFFAYAQFCNYMAFVALLIIRDTTQLIGNDKNYESMEGVFAFMYLIHTNLLIDIIEEFEHYTFEITGNTSVNRRLRNISGTSVSVIDPMSPTLSGFKAKHSQSYSVDSNVSKQYDRAKFTMHKSVPSDDSRFPRHTPNGNSSIICSIPDSSYPIDEVMMDKLQTMQINTSLGKEETLEKGSMESFHSGNSEHSPTDFEMVDTLNHKLNNLIEPVAEEEDDEPWRE